MIYVCIPSFNEAPTIGLLLWRVRQVFTDFSREYRLLVADDASTDATAELLEPYQRALPLTVVRHQARRGPAACLEVLLQRAIDDSDRPKRDCAIVLHADFAHQPQAMPDIVRALDGGADLVAVEGRARGLHTRGERLLRSYGSTLLSGAVRVPGVHDLLSGYLGVRLTTAKTALAASAGPFLRTDGWAVRAELLARLTSHARRVDTVTVDERFDLRQREPRSEPWPEAVRLWKARRQLRDIPRGQAVSTTRHSAAAPAEPADIAV